MTRGDNEYWTRGDKIVGAVMVVLIAVALVAANAYLRSREISALEYEQVADIVKHSPAAEARLQAWKREGRTLLTARDLVELRELGDREAEASAMLNAKLRVLGPAVLDAPKEIDPSSTE